MKPMRKWTKNLLISLAALALMMTGCFGFSATSFAYFNFGTVGVSLGKSSVSLNAGSSESISVKLTPASHDQLPGCGMEECPQQCGNYPDKDCLDANGQCTCNGKTYSTYYTDVSVSSDNTSVATASYSGNALKITGVGAGDAVITVTGSLRQWTAGSATVKVSVSAADSSGGETGGASWSIDSSGSSGSSGSSSSGGGNNNTVTATPAGGTNNAQGGTQQTEEGTPQGEIEEEAQEEAQEETQEETQEEAEEDNEITVIDSDRGTIYMVPVTPGIPQGKDLFEQIMGKEDAYVDFQMKDQSENILYAWEFWGKEVTRAEDMDFGIEYSQTPFDGCSYGSSDNSLYLHFAHEDEFVGKASIFLNVAEYFSDDDVLYLYRYDPETDSIELVAEGLTVENGYVTMELTEGGYYILTTEELLAEPEEEEIEEEPEVTEEPIEPEAAEPEEVAEEHTGLSAGAIAAIIIIAAAVAALIIFLVIRVIRKKKNGPDGGIEEGAAVEPEEDIAEGVEAEPEEDIGEGAEMTSKEDLEESPEEGNEE